MGQTQSSLGRSVGLKRRQSQQNNKAGNAQRNRTQTKHHISRSTSKRELETGLIHTEKPSDRPRAKNSVRFQCSQCRRLIEAIEYLRAVYDPETCFSAPIGTFGDLQIANCRLCKWIHEALSGENALGTPPWQETCVLRVDWLPYEGPNGSIAMTYMRESPVQNLLELIFATCPTCDRVHPLLPHHLFLTSPLPKEFDLFQDQHFAPIDVQEIHQWLLNCDARHHGQCHGLEGIQRLEPPRTLLLIDTQQECLVHIQLPARYAALSYVWGQLEDTLETTVSNFAALQIPGSISKSIGSVYLPATIRDAIRLSSALQIQYLWVDRICIVQDDHASKTFHLQQMGSIYNNAYITIVAADGEHADYGIRGIGFGAQSRDPKFMNDRRLPLYSKYVLVPDPVRDCSRFEPQDDNPFTWHHRAWTYQESLLSRRRLVFFRGTVYFGCVAGVRFEGVGTFSKTQHDDETMNRPGMHSDCGFNFDSKPDLPMFAKLVEDYNARHLTFQRDALDAFSAVLDALERSFKAGFFFGLPEQFFDLALFWEPLGKPRRNPALRSDGNPLFPSWSWLGKERNITFNDWRSSSGIINLKKSSSMVRWTRFNPTSGTRQSIVNNRNSSYQLPENWPASSTNSRDDFSCILQGEVQIVSLMFGDIVQVDSHPEGMSRFFIHQSSGAWAGVLCPDQYLPHNISHGDECELVTITKAIDFSLKPFGLSQLFEWYKPWPQHNRLSGVPLVKELRHLKVYEYYNVMWVEWKNDVAYRKGIGRVWKPVWDRLEKREALVTFG